MGGTGGGNTATDDSTFVCNGTACVNVGLEECDESAGEVAKYTDSTNSFSCVAVTASGTGTDSVGTDELDDGSDTPAVGEVVKVATCTVNADCFEYATDDDIPEAGDYTNLTGGNGIANSPTGTIAVDLLTSGSNADSSTTNSDSGLEFIGGKLSLFRGCADGEAPIWDETNDRWACGTAGSGDMTKAVYDTGDNGSVDTADALAADPANCSAGYFPLGVDASGVVQSCTNLNGLSSASPTDDYMLVGNGTVWQSKALPGGPAYCTDLDEKLYWSTSTNSWACAGVIVDADAVIMGPNLTGYAVPDCDGASSVLQYDTTTHAWSCATFGTAGTIDTASAGTDQGEVYSVDFGSDFSVTLDTACIGGTEEGTSCTTNSDCAGSGTCTANQQLDVSLAATVYRQGDEIQTSDLPTTGRCHVATFGPNTPASSAIYCAANGACNTAVAAVIIPPTPASTMSDLRCRTWYDFGTGDSFAFTVQTASASSCDAAGNDGVNACSFSSSSLTCTITGDDGATDDMYCEDTSNSATVTDGNLIRLYGLVSGTPAAKWFVCTALVCLN